MTHGYYNKRPTVAFPAAAYHRHLTDIKLYCLVIESNHKCLLLIAWSATAGSHTHAVLITSLFPVTRRTYNELIMSTGVTSDIGLQSSHCWGPVLVHSYINAMCYNFYYCNVGMTLKGHWRSSTIVPIDRTYITLYYWFAVTMSPSCTVYEILRCSWITSSCTW